jgi:ribosomal protein S12 methylthiotransferase
MKKIALVSLGCAKNLVDSEVMLGYLEQAGYSLVIQLEEADIIIINTCGFIQPARTEAEEHIAAALQVKRSRPETRIAVTGCYSQIAEDELRQRFPEIDLWTGIGDFHHIVEILEGRTYEAQDGCFLYDHTSPRKLSTPSVWAYVKISEGCSHRCSFCTIPRIKGPYRSRPLDSVIAEGKRLLSQGVKEINLISQDSTYYGRDLGKKEGLAELLEKLAGLPGRFWIRVLYSYPDEITGRLLDIMQEEKVCSYLDAPFQHSHPKIIRSMRRGMAGDKALLFLGNVRKKIPDVVFRTSLIVGYPGEGPDEFAHLRDFVRSARFEHLGVFVYSPEKDTLSYERKEEVPETEKESRRREVMELQAGISAEHNRERIGSRLEVLLEGRLQQDPRYIVGRTCFQAPEVDGVVLVKASESVRSAGVFEQVEIQDGDVYDLYGTIKT